MLMKAKCGNSPTGKVADKTVKAKGYAIVEAPIISVKTGCRSTIFALLLQIVCGKNRPYFWEELYG
jgi:hypothetical protein